MKYNKLLPLSLSGVEYDALARRAREQERDPVQQARYILREALKNDDTEVSVVSVMNGVRRAASLDGAH